MLSIREVANRVGVTVATLRFYEEKGLLVSRRGPGNRRCYPLHVLRRLALISAARRLGLSLGEIAEALRPLPSERPPTAAEWARISGPWLARVDREIGHLHELRRSLASCIPCGCLLHERCALTRAREG